MIVGVVTPDREPIIQIVVHGPSRREHHIEALVDTGFDGWLPLPAETIERLELQRFIGRPQRMRIRYL